MKRIRNTILFLLVLLTIWGCNHENNAPMQVPVPGKIVINEVLYDPVGNNAGHQLVELKNIGTEPVELNDWWFCARQDYSQIPNVTLDGGSYLILHIGDNGTNTPTEVFLPTMLTLQSISDLNLYDNPDFCNPGSMVHFVQWGGVPPTSRESEAVDAGFWTANDFVPGVSEGHSIEYTGTGNASADWFEQSNPSIGF